MSPAGSTVGAQRRASLTRVHTGRTRRLAHAQAHAHAHMPIQPPCHRPRHTPAPHAPRPPSHFPPHRSTFSALHRLLAPQPGDRKQQPEGSGTVRNPLPAPAAPTDSGPALINELEPPLRPHLGMRDWVAAVMGNKRVWLRASSGNAAAEGYAGAACVIFPLCIFEPRGAGHIAGQIQQQRPAVGGRQRAPRPPPGGRRRGAAPGCRNRAARCGSSRCRQVAAQGGGCAALRAAAAGALCPGRRELLGDREGTAGIACWADWQRLGAGSPVLADCCSLLLTDNCGFAACMHNMELFFFFPYAKLDVTEGILKFSSCFISCKFRCLADLEICICMYLSIFVCMHANMHTFAFMYSLLFVLCTF